MREFLRFYVLEDAFYVHFAVSIIRILDSALTLYTIFNYTILKRSEVTIIKELRVCLRKGSIVNEIVNAVIHYLLVGFFYGTTDKSYAHNYALGKMLYYVAVFFDILAIILTLKIKKKISKKE